MIRVSWVLFHSRLQSFIYTVLLKVNVMEEKVAVMIYSSNFPSLVGSHPPPSPRCNNQPQ